MNTTLLLQFTRLSTNIRTRRRRKFIFSFPNTGYIIQQRRYQTNINSTSQFSEDRLNNWCCRLWGLGQYGNKNNNFINYNERISNISSSLSSTQTEMHRGMLLNEVQNQAKLADELKAVMIGEKGKLPDSVVEAVWNVYESIILPDILNNISSNITPEQEKRFFEFIALLTELDINLSDVRESVEKLTRSINDIESILNEIQNDSPSKGNHNSIISSSNNNNNNTAILSTKLVLAKNTLLRQCFAVRHAGSPVHYLWLRQTASLDRGMRRLMDLRRCITYFNNKCRQNITKIQQEQKISQKLEIEANNNNIDNKLNELELWVTRQRHLSSIDGALQFLFSDFFAKEWLIMEELTWNSTPPSLLEQVITSEKVHAFTNGISDMKYRLQPTKNRHIFAFFHPAVVEEPLIAVQVALTKGIANSVDYILGRPSPLNNNNSNNNNKREKEENENSSSDNDVDTAIFYSINSAQSALRGVNLGNLLIKRVVREIEAKLNTTRQAAGLSPITTFSTLSPIPGYISWLTTEVGKLQQCVLVNKNKENNNKNITGNMKFSQHRIFGDINNDFETILFLKLRTAIFKFAEKNQGLNFQIVEKLQFDSSDVINDVSKLAIMQFLLEIFNIPDKNSTKESHNIFWWEDHEFTSAIKSPLLRSVAYYLFKEKRRNRILDPVGNFHISNGATMLRLNFLANCTPSGSRESATIMVNYHYDPARVSERVQAYELYRTVSVGDNILKCLEIV